MSTNQSRLWSIVDQSKPYETACAPVKSSSGETVGYVAVSKLAYRGYTRDELDFLDTLAMSFIAVAESGGKQEQSQPPSAAGAGKEEEE